ncbi:MAG: nucleotide exchange factor GrpE [Candidatus Altiarchaeota archaeon]
MLKKKSKKEDLMHLSKVDEKSKEKTDEKNLEEKLKECEDQLLRLRAEFENYKKQLDTQYMENVKNANASLIKEILPVIDEFEIAIEDIRKKDEKTAEGIELIYKKMMKILEQNGLKAIDSVGKKFDPYYHEVLMNENSEKEDGIILEEFQKGYLFNGKVIRHSKVKISCHIEDQKGR